MTPTLSPHSCAILHTLGTENVLRAMSIMVEVEGMKAANAQFPENQPHMQEAFDRKAAQIRGFADYLSGCLSSHLRIAEEPRP